MNVQPSAFSLLPYCPTSYIAAYDGISTMSSAIKIRQWDWSVSHISWIDGADLTNIEAWRGQVRRNPNFEHTHTPGTVVRIYRVLGETPEHTAKVRAFLHAQVGKKYDSWGCLAFVLRRDSLQNQDRWFCSELVFAAYEAAGLPLLLRIPAYKVMPANLVHSPLLQFFAQGKVGGAPIFPPASQGSTESIGSIPETPGKNALQPARRSAGTNPRFPAPRPEKGQMQPNAARFQGKVPIMQHSPVSLLRNSALFTPAFRPDPLLGLDGGLRGVAAGRGGFLSRSLPPLAACRLPLAPLPNATATLPASGDALIGMVNALGAPDATGALPQWLEVPYADVGNKVNGKPVMQRLNRKIAEEMVGLWNGWREGLARRFGGVPVYVGHPDSAEFRALGDTDDNAYAWVLDIKATETALLLNVDWSEEGTQIVRSKKRKFFSPFFLGRPAGMENGVQVYEPVILQSVGLHNKPRWPVAPLVNAEDMGGTAMTLLERIKALLGMNSVTDDDSAVNAVQALISACQKIKEAVEAKWRADDAARSALPNTLGPIELAAAYIEHLGAQLAGQATQLANAVTAADQAKTELVNAQAVIKAERTGRAALVIDAAIGGGKIVVGDRDTRIAELVNATAFDTESARIAALPKLMKTAPVVTDGGARNSKTTGARTQFLELVNAHMTEKGCDYDTAYAAMRKTHGALLETGKEGSDSK